VSIKKGVGPRDHRSEPDEGSTSEKFRVDRVFVPNTPRRDPAGTTSPSTTPRRPTGNTQPPILGTAPGVDDAELALRRQLSRLQRQLADAQRELANKDDELAASVEKRVELSTSLETALGHLRDSQLALDDIKAEYQRLAGVEQRLQDAIAAADELTHQLERERAERAAIALQLDETTNQFDRARVLWKDETALSQEHHAAELAKVEVEKRRAIDAAEAAMKVVMERQETASAAKIAELEAAHERALATLRGELEPKVAEARNLAAEIERLNSEIAALRAEQMREMAERNDLFKWEQQQAAEAHAAELAALTRKHETDIAKHSEDLAAKVQALATVERNAQQREQLWEQTTNGLRESQKKLQLELADAKEKLAQEGASKWNIEQRLVAALQQVEDLSRRQDDLVQRVETAEADARRNELDRERFAAYLEEGLAMLGAIPAKDMSVPTEIPARPTASYEAVAADEDSGAVALPPPPLEDPTKA
jgi:DNA repair exonuclease SbcCD ATPase subunit